MICQPLFIRALLTFLVLFGSTNAAADNDNDETKMMMSNQIDYEWWRTRAPIQFSHAYQDNMVLQQAPASASVTGHLGHVDCPKNPADRPMVVVSIHIDKDDYDAHPSPAIYSVDAEVYPETNLGEKYCSFRAVFPPTRTGGSYTFEARYMTTKPSQTAKIRHVTFGEVWFCSGQSNMALTLQYTLSRDESIDKIQSGSYDNIRIHGLEGNMNKDQPWRTAMDAEADGTFLHYSSTCYYFAEKLTDEYRANKQTPPPIGLIHTAWGGSAIEDWVDDETLASCTDTCHEQIKDEVDGGLYNRHGYSLLEWHGLPYVNMTIKGFLWYQGENNMNMVPKCVLGNSERQEGYSCLMVGLVRLWRKLWSATPGTTDPLAPFVVVALPMSGTEGNPNIALMRWAQTGGYGVLPNPAMPNTFLVQSYDIDDPYRGVFDLCYHGECCYPGKSFSYGHSDPEPCVDSEHQTEKYAGFQCNMCDELCGDFCVSAYANNFYMGTIHPRLKYPLGSRVAETVARSVYEMKEENGHVISTGPTLAGCAVDNYSKSLRVFFNATLLAGDSVIVHEYNRSIAGRSKMEVLVATDKSKNRLCLDVSGGECVDDGHGNKFRWEGMEASNADWTPVHILRQEKATNMGFEIAVDLGSIDSIENIMAIRYAWEGDCCWSQHEDRTLDKLSRSCPPKTCPLYSVVSELPANPFLAEIIDGKCKCLSPQVCDGDGSLPPEMPSPPLVGITSRIKKSISTFCFARIGSKLTGMGLSTLLVGMILLYTYRRRKRQAKTAEEADESEMIELVW